MPILFSTWIVSGKSVKIVKFVRCTIIIDTGMAPTVFGIVWHSYFGLEFLDINENQIAAKAVLRTPDEGTLLVNLIIT